MVESEFYYSSADHKTRIHAVKWLPEGTPRAVLQIAHGVTEHILCYRELAEYFTKRGFVVVGNDHLGHGSSIAQDSEPMYFGGKNSWFTAERDLYTCRKLMKRQYPDIPYIILGFSLGSFLVRTLLIRHPGKADAAILAGTGQIPLLQLKIAEYMAKKEARRAGEQYTTPLIGKLTFETYNRQFAPNRTKCDWLCASEEGLQRYLDDPLRGEAMSAGLFRELLNGMHYTGSIKNQRQMDTTMPILLLSGDNDPVGANGKGVRKVYTTMKKAGVQNISKKLYPGLRHDIFLEDERYNVFGDIEKWIDQQCAVAE